MKLIVGLGNPGREYDKSRHNIGFMVLDHYLNNLSPKWTNKFNGLYFETIINDKKVIFLKPQSYMNLSGEVVIKFVNYFKINIDDILVISDDLDLFFLNFKLRDSGSCGGHNGLRNIEQHLGSNNYKRLKIGISNNKDIDTKDYVLGKFSKEELSKLDDLFININDVIDDYFKMNFKDLMCKYNRKNK